MNPQDPLATRFSDVRSRTITLAEAFSDEDLGVQAMPDASPGKWHLGHTTWFFEAVVLAPHAPRFTPFDARFSRLFNSYYESLGPRHPRPRRGLLTRPALAEVLRWRRETDDALLSFLATADGATAARAAPLVELGLHHEQQHQELLITDLLHAFAQNPIEPVMFGAGSALARVFSPAPAPAPGAAWVGVEGGVVAIGHGGGAFAFDNEAPRHRVHLEPFELASRLVTNGQYAAFVEDGGYREPRWWHSDGWAQVQAGGWAAPPMWREDAEFGPAGLAVRDARAPVRHLSFYEAAAFAAWAGARLPTEFEWEAAVAARPEAFADAFGHVWQWTASAYGAYPGFRTFEGAAAEYNDKFMVGQQVLRGSSLATSPGHARTSYRNFFPPAARWQFTGLRLARDLHPTPERQR
jgi:ergothioneine biosynthesis protein EgtB